jgi:hypothetical protein
LTGLFEDAKNRSIAHIKGMSDCLSGFTRDVTSHYQLRGQVRMAIPGGSALGIENMPSLGSRAANSGSVNKLPNRFKVGRHNTGDALNAIASEIELDRIISVRLRSFSGHIFNLSTMDGYYTINKGLYTGNTIRASNEGQQQLWNQAIEQELIDPNEWEREWIADETERTCEICMGLDGTRAPIDGTFEGGYARPPDPHPSCRCAVGLVRKE